MFKKFTHILCQIVSQMASNTEQKERRSSIGKAIEIHNYINGEFEKSDKYFSSYNPALNRLNALIPDSDDQDVNRAVRAAKAAFERWYTRVFIAKLSLVIFDSWSKTGRTDRAALLNRIATLIEMNAIELAKLESIDQGKPVWLANTLDIPRASMNFRHFANCLQNDADM